MTYRYPKSQVMAILISGMVMILYAAAAFGFGQADLHLLWQVPLVGIFAWVFSWLILDAVLYRKLKNFKAENELEIRKLKEMESFRREFIGDVSHELKTPIFAIQGYLETLLEGAITDERVNVKFLQKALKHSDRLSNLVQDILVITQVESGELVMHMSRWDLEVLVNEVLDSLSYKFTHKGRDIKYKVGVKGLTDTYVEADRERIDQVLRNLIDNAVKYGDSKGTVYLDLESQPGSRIGVKVRDEGQGIDPAHLPRLFERFYRVDKSRSRDKGGTGLGLAICKHLVEAHGEKIWVESESSRGTTFQFTLKKST
jgi:two-component system phosphate regulon sensor histidine kinase PhoR